MMSGGMPGAQFGRFTVRGELGAGGMGRVFRAYDPTLRREVAIKILRNDPSGAAGDLVAEARSASRLNHPNVCTIYDVGDVDGVPFIAMELVDGRPLNQLISAGGLSVDAALRLGLQIAGALAHAHEHGIVHGDLKGHNVLVTPRGSVKLLDFGLARTLEPATLDSITQPAPAASDEAIAGTLPFMAPETLRGAPLSPAADVWALGVLLYEMITGTRPFRGERTYEIAAAILSETPRPLPSAVPAAVTRVIARCLEKAPAERYATALEPFAALEPLTSSGRDLREAASGPETPPPAHRVSTAVLIGAGAILALVAGVTAWVVWRPAAGSTTASRAQVTSLIVLPFDNLSHKPEEDYFADGMTETLITNLSRIPTLTVISRTSSIRYKALGKSSQEIARELHVGAIVEGTVQRDAGQVRIGVRLIDASSDRNLWGHEYTRELTDVLALQGDVARAIASEIRASFTPADEARLAHAGSVNTEAHEAFLKGRYYWNRRTPDSLREALTYYQRAVALEPDYAPAYAGMAQCFVLLPGFPISSMAPSAAMPQAIEAAEHALALDSRLAEAHAALGYARLHSLEFAKADAELRQALAIDPSSANTHFWYAAALGAMKKFDESIDQARQGAALDPVSPIVATGVAWMHHLARRFDQEVTSSQAALALEPDFMIARYRLGEGYLHQDRFTEAIAELERASMLSHGGPDLIAGVAYAQGRAGRQREALAALQTLKDMGASGTRYVSPYLIALVYTGLRQNDDALSWLTRAVQERAWGAAFLAVEADFDPLRADPRFTALLQRSGLMAQTPE